MARRSLVGAVLLALVVTIWAPMAAADDDPYTNPTPPTVEPFEEERDPGDPPTTETVLGTTQSRGPLPLTGGDVIGLVILGGGLAGVGLVLRAGARRRSAASV
ncbi:MAG: hypothetical protein ACOYXM_10825 [Actinomycetota bacterium]